SRAGSEQECSPFAALLLLDLLVRFRRERLLPGGMRLCLSAVDQGFAGGAQPQYRPLFRAPDRGAGGSHVLDARTGLRIAMRACRAATGVVLGSAALAT